MNAKKYILSIDQGTSSTKALIFDEQCNVLAKGSVPLHTSYLTDGFVEQDPEHIYENVLASVKACLAVFENAGGKTSDIASLGISNQRETFVVWDVSGKPLHPAIVWQCKRSVQVCGDLQQQGLAALIKSNTGLPIDPYFSASKLIWLNQHNDNIKNAIANGTAYFGTIDTWLLYKLTNGSSYFTDYTNASRTMLFNLHTLSWDEKLVEVFGLTGIHLPELKSSSAHFADTDLGGLLNNPIPVTAMVGDSHAAAFGETCFEKGNAKATLGTGCSILMNTGAQLVDSDNGMVTTICWSIPGRVDYALEGVIVSCGATIDWLKNELSLFSDSKETAAMAASIPHNGGVYLVPAFSGLGSPHWNMERRASITGLNFGAGKNHIVRAALESIPYQVKDVIDAMQRDAGIELNGLMLDGGISANEFVIQFLADLLDKKITLIGMPDVSALGAACLAGLYMGIYPSLEVLKTINAGKQFVEPVASGRMEENYEGWCEAVGSKK